jgi:ABC-type phosphate transport system substrate-binding protein
MKNSILTIALLAALSTAAHAGVVVVGHPSAAPLTKAQVEDIFLGKNLSAAPVDLPEGSPVRDQFYTKATGRDAAQVKATWSRIAFSGKGTPPKAAADAAAVKKAVAADPKAVGYIDAAAVDGSVKVLLTLE